jgi:hypothetical protein
VPDDLSSLIGEIKKLVEKLDAPKKADWSLKISAITPFLSTVVVAGLSLWLTWSNQQGQIRLAQESTKLAQENAKNEKDFRDAQVRVAELEAISKLIPALSSKDPTERKRAEELLQAVQQSKTISASELETKTVPGAGGGNGKPGSTEPSKSVFDNFAMLVANETAPAPSRVDAAAKLAKAVSQPGISNEERRHAEEVLAGVAQSPGTPAAVRSAAELAIANIRQVSSSQIGDLVKNEPVSRPVDEVILHHSYIPNSHDYKGLDTIKIFAEAWEQRGYKSLAVHYLIAPDGTIWTGRPLNEPGTHTAGKNKTTVGVMLILDGDKELPSNPQREALVALLKALFSKFKIRASDNFAPGHGFHHDYFPKTCPGTLITKQLVLSWLNGTAVSAR